jgi:hypothetical protein
MCSKNCCDILAINFCELSDTTVESRSVLATYSRLSFMLNYLILSFHVIFFYEQFPTYKPNVNKAFYQTIFHSPHKHVNSCEGKNFKRTVPPHMPEVV